MKAARRAIVGILGALLLLIGFPNMVGLAAASTGQHALLFAHYGQHDPALVDSDGCPGGPPAHANTGPADSLDNYWSGDAAARPEGAASPPAYAYDHQGPHAQVAQGSGTTLERDRVPMGDLSSLAPAGVAAKDATPAFARSQYGRVGTADRAAAIEKSPTCPYCGQSPSSQVDHITSMKQDWTSGGWADDAATRTARVNDPDNLIGACASCNASKGAREIGEGAGQWWPSRWPSGVWWPFG